MKITFLLNDFGKFAFIAYNYYKLDFRENFEVSTFYNSLHNICFFFRFLMIIGSYFITQILLSINTNHRNKSQFNDKSERLKKYVFFF